MAERVLRQALAQMRDSSYFDLPFIYYYLGESLFRQNNYAEAIRYFQAYVQQYAGRALKALAYLKIGLSLEMLGQYAQAREYYMRIQSRREGIMLKLLSCLNHCWRTLLWLCATGQRRLIG